MVGTILKIACILVLGVCRITTKFAINILSPNSLR
jgi:hypothetical protein